MFDVAIVGAGPAGSAAALAARKVGATVLLLDSAQFPRDKVCGDGVAPQALDVLAELGVDVYDLVKGTEPITTLRLSSPGGVTATGDFNRPARVVPRLWFDDRLLQAARAAGTEYERHRVRAITHHDDHVDIDGRWRARTVIGADGAESVVRRLAGFAAAREGTVALAVRGYVTADSWPAGEQVLRMTATDWPAYAWAFPVGDGRANVGYGQLLRGTPPTRDHLRRRLGELLPETAAEVEVRGHRLPLSTGRPAYGRNRVLLAGDAASLINPLTGEGIYYAVRSGSLAGAAAVHPDPVATYKRSMRTALGGHLRQSDLVARLASHPGLVDLVTAAAGSNATLFDRLVEFGLADGRLGLRQVPALVRAAVRSR